MKWSMKLARIAGIDVFVHWTFLILIFWLLGIHIAQGNSIAMALFETNGWWESSRWKILASG